MPGRVLTPLFVSSDKKSDCASAAQSLCGVAYNKENYNVPRGTNSCKKTGMFHVEQFFGDFEQDKVENTLQMMRIMI